MNAHVATADHLQAQTYAHLHNAIQGFREREQMRLAAESLRGVHTELVAAMHETELLSTHRPVFAELAVQEPTHTPVEMDALLVDEGGRYPEIRAELVRVAVNAIGWIEAIDRCATRGES